MDRFKAVLHPATDRWVREMIDTLGLFGSNIFYFEDRVPSNTFSLTVFERVEDQALDLVQSSRYHTSVIEALCFLVSNDLVQVDLLSVTKALFVYSILGNELLSFLLLAIKIASISQLNETFIVLFTIVIGPAI